MQNYREIKRILKNKVRFTESFLVFFLITGSISYSEVATEITKDEIIEKDYTIIGNSDNPSIEINVQTNEDKNKYSGVWIEDGIFLTNIGTISSKIALEGGIITSIKNFGDVSASIFTYNLGNGVYGNLENNNGFILGKVDLKGGTATADIFGLVNTSVNASAYNSGNGIYGNLENNDGYISGLINLEGGIATSTGVNYAYSSSYDSGNGIYGNIGANNGTILGEVDLKGGVATSINYIVIGDFIPTSASVLAKRSGNGIYGNIEINNGFISGIANSKGGTATANFDGYPSFASASVDTSSLGNGIYGNINENNGLILGLVNAKGGVANSTSNSPPISYASAKTNTSGNGIYGNINNNYGLISGVANVKGGAAITNLISNNADASVNIDASGNGIYGYIKNNIGTISGKIDVKGGVVNGTLTGIDVWYSGNGVCTPSPLKYLISMNNYGLVKGVESAIYRENSEMTVNNYGILAGQQIIGSGGIPTKVHVNDYNNYGTEVIINENGVIKNVNVANGGIVTLDKNGSIKVYTVLNGTNEGRIASEEKSYTENTYISSSNLANKENIIINGAGVGIGALDVVNETTIEKAIINGYETALTVNGGNKFKGTDVTFNGGGFGKFDENTEELNYAVIIKGDEGNNTLEILGNSIINGKVDLGFGNDNLLVSNGTQINGDMDGGDGIDKLQLGNGIDNEEHPLNNHDGNNDGIIDKGDWRGLAIYHEIKSFENIDVEGAVTLYETAKIIGDSNIHIGKDSSLNLRIDPTKKDSSGRIIGHALYTVGDKTIATEAHNESVNEYHSKGGGTLNIITNGLGVGGVIAMSELKIGRTSSESIGTTILDPNKENLYVRTDSIIHSATVHTGNGSKAVDYSNAQVGDIKVTVNPDILIVTPKPIDPEPPVNKYQPRYDQLNKIYKSLIADGDNINAIYPTTNITLLKEYLNYPVQSDITDMALGNLLTLLNEIYTASPYSFSNELSRESMGLYSDAIVDNPFKAREKEWMVYGGLLHESADLKDRYYGKNYHGFDTTDKTTNVKIDNKITGAYALAEYGIDSSLSVAGILGGSKNKSDISNGSNLDGNSFYIGGYIKKDIEEWRIIGGLGYQYTDYDAKRIASNIMQSFSYNNNYNDNGLNIYLNGRYNYSLGNDYYLVPKAKFSYTYIKQDGVNEGDKPLAMNVDSKSFDVFEGLVGVDLKKEFLHENGKSALKAGVAYKRILSGYEDEYLTANMKNGSDFDLLVPNKVKNNYIIGIGYEYESQKGVLFNVNGSYSFDVKESNSVRDSSGTKNSVNGWTVGLGIGYRLPN